MDLNERDNKNKEKSELEKFISSIALPAFKEITTKLESKDREVITITNTKYAIITMKYKGKEQFSFKIIPRVTLYGAYPLGVAVYPREDGIKDEEICDLRYDTKDDIVRKILNRYKYYCKILSQTRNSSS